MVELLISIIIISVCLLSILSIENVALKNTHSSYLYSLATKQLLALSEKFSAGIGKAEFAAWNEENARILPHGKGTLSGSSSAGYKIKLCWKRENEKKKCISN